MSRQMKNPILSNFSIGRKFETTLKKKKKKWQRTGRKEGYRGGEEEENWVDPLKKLIGVEDRSRDGEFKK